jgi:hypothetical protein
MRSHLRALFITVVLVCAAPALAAGPNLLVNPDFETGDLTGWTVSGNAERGVGAEGSPITGTTVPGNYVHVRSGQFAAFAKLQTNPPATTLTLEQTVDVVPGIPYERGFSNAMFGTQSVGSTFSHTTRVVGHSAVFTGSGTGTGNTTGRSFGGGWVFPPGQTTTTITFEFSGFASGGDLAGFSIDDFYFGQVPEPTGLATLAAIATLALFTSRRRGRC